MVASLMRSGDHDDAAADEEMREIIAYLALLQILITCFITYFFR